MIVQRGLMTGQVLQRLEKGANATVTGACETSGEVQVAITWGIRAVKGWTHRGRARGGTFNVKLEGIPTGGPYAVTLSAGSETVTVKNIFVGDVWVLAGQSNMQGCGNMDRAPKPHPKVSALYMDGHWDIAQEPIHFLPESPDPVHNPVAAPLEPAKIAAERRKAKKGVGPGLVFGAEMFRRSRVPQGLICTAHGGTSMQQWSPEKKGEGGNSLYGSMLKSWGLTGQPVAGVLWYQGESDANETDALLYTRRMKELVAAMRKDFHHPELPFLLVQIGKFFTAQANSRAWNSIQDQEANLHKHIHHCACVSAADLPLDDAIHVSSDGYTRLGVRLARLADHFVNGKAKEALAPEVESLKKRTVDGVGIIEVVFKNVTGGLRSDGYPAGFALVDQDGRDSNTIFKTELDGNRVRLHADPWHTDNSNLVYGHGYAPVLNITDLRDMPIPVLGARSLGKPQAITPFLSLWHVSKILPEANPIDAWGAPAPAPDQGLMMKKFESIFCDMHMDWAGKLGQAVFFCSMDLSEPMDLTLRLGYDGPIRAWIDDTAVFTDMTGTNPAIADAKTIPLKVGQGQHRIAVAMDLNKGRTWGFFLRFERTDVTPKRLLEQDVAMPKFSI